MKNDIKSRLSLAFLWIFSFIVIIVLLTFVSHAESPYFPMEQNANNLFTDGMISALDTQFDTENNYAFIYTYSFAYGEYYGFACYIAKGDATAPYLFGEINNDGNAFSLYPLQGYSLMKFSINPTTNVIRLYPTAGTNASNYANLPSSSYNSNYDYISNFRLYTSNVDNADVVLKYGHDPNPPIDVGSAIIPPSAFIPQYLTGDNAPSNVPPTYSSSSYTWTNKPTFDNTSVINGIQSIKNTLEWLSDNLKGEIANLLNNLKSLAEYIGKTIQYYGNAIISTLNNFIQNFYDNMSSLVQPIYEKLVYFTEPLDLQEVENALSSSSTYSLVTSASSLKNTYQNFFDSITVPSTLSFSIPYTILTQTGYIDFNFGWYADIRDSVLPWIVGFLYMGFGLALFRSFPSIIHGVSGILQKGG